MNRAFLILILIMSIIVFPGCSQSNQTGTGNHKDSGASAGKDNLRIIFAKNNPENVSYEQHVVTLWEQTKPLLKEDIAKNYSDEEYKKLGADIDMAWVNLQIHSSLDHAEEMENHSDVPFNNLSGDVLMLIDSLYGTRDLGKVEGREERRKNLRQGRLEYKINQFDKILERLK
ncbi:MAG: hypothetical protein M0T74_03810 [Desulfitobacterium hafniense]|nr:hypothetical protein [Desulfitobacterium hafniense]